MKSAAAALLPDPELVQVEYLAPQPDLIVVILTTTRPTAACPACARMAARVHSRYDRTVADLPWNTVRVRLRIRSRRFFCDQPACSRSIFTERLPGLVEP